MRKLFTPTNETTPWHGLTGRFSATVISLLVDRAVIRAWLHSGITLPEGNEAEPHPVFLYLGRQESVSPTIFGRAIRFPFCYSYPEIITAVPDLEIRSAEGERLASPVTYLPKLFLGSWGATLFGRWPFGICKSYAHFDVGPVSFHASNRRGDRLLDAEIVCSDHTVSIGGQGGLSPDHKAFLPQPVVLGRGNQLGLGRLEFDFNSGEIRPARVSLDTAPGLVSWMPQIQTEIHGCDEVENGAFFFTADWKLTRHN